MLASLEVDTGMKNENHMSVYFQFWNPVASAVELYNCHLALSSQLFSLFNLFCSIFFLLLIIFSHFLHPVSAVKWPIVKEQIVCV